MTGLGSTADAVNRNAVVAFGRLADNQAKSNEAT